MKKLKLLVAIMALFFAAAVITFFVVRSPSYNLQTNGKLYIVNKLSSSITIFDLFEGEEIGELPISVEPHELATLSNQDRIVVTNYGTPDVRGNAITVINTKTNKIEKEIGLEGSFRPHGIIALPSPNKVGVVTDVGNDLVIVDTQKGVIEQKIPTNQRVSHLVVHHPTKPLLYVSNINSNSVSVIDLDTNQIIKTISCGIGAEGIDITPDGEEVWVANNKDNSINIISTSTNTILDTLATGAESLRLKFSVDGKHCLVTNSSDGTISVYDKVLRKQIKTITIPGKKNLLERALYHTPRPVGILMHPNGDYAFIANSNADKVEIIDMKSFEIIGNIGTGRVPDGMTFVE